MAEKEVKSFYSKFAKMYDLFKKLWDIISHNAEEELRTFLTEKGKIFLIFSTKPKRYINIIARPIYKWINAQYVSRIEIAKIKNIKYKRKYFFDLITVIEIAI